MQKFYVDRFEGDTAVLVAGSDGPELRVARDQLPAATSEGQWLTKTSSGGYEAVADGTRQRVQGLMDEMSG